MSTLHSAPRALAYWSGIAGRDQRREAVARILCFHGTPRHRAAELERQLRYLKRQFTIVALSDLVAGMHDRGSSIGGLVAVTFDDGLRNNVSVAYPILQRLEIPATFFVCPGITERRGWLWNHEARQRLQFADEGLRHELAAQHGTSPEVAGFITWMKTLGLVSRRRVENALREATPGYVPSAAERHEFDAAGWNELRALDPSLVTIGSHSMTHAILPYLKADELEFELAESRRMLEARLDRAVERFAYPNGDHSPLVVDCVRRHYASALACAPTWVRSGCDLHVLPRYATPSGVLRLALSLHRHPAAHQPWRQPRPSVAGAPL